MLTKDRLSKALGDAGLIGLSLRAQMGEFDDFLSPHVAPTVMLATELAELITKLNVIRDAVMNGEYDSTEAEAEAWAESTEGSETLQRLYRGK